MGEREEEPLLSEKQQNQFPHLPVLRSKRAAPFSRKSHTQVELACTKFSGEPIVMASYRTEGYRCSSKRITCFLLKLHD
jgi:hypothetical protein